MNEGRREDETALPAVDVAQIRGARVALRAGWIGETSRVRIACVEAPAARWVPGLETIVFSRANAIARAASPIALDRLEALPSAAFAHGFEQRATGDGRDGAVAQRAEVKHTLAFTERGDVALLCSTLCLESAAGTRCSALVDTAKIAGRLTPPPAPGLVLRAILGAADRPLEAGAAALFAFALGVAWLLARRPKRPLA